MVMFREYGRNNLSDSQSLSIGIVVPTYQAEKHLHHCLPPLLHALSTLRQTHQVSEARLLVIDSSSEDATVQIAHALGAETLVIPKQEFHHAKTREKARKHLNSDIVIMVTQDAYANEQTIEHLIRPILEEEASVSYARQIPHDNAGHFESFHRHFNYPANSHVRSLAERQQYGIYTFFCSNSCAAYLNKALDEIGGFPDVSFGEDTFAVARLLHRNHKIAYVAESIVKHSHHYTLIEEYRRNYIIGQTRNQQQKWLEGGSRDAKRGWQYVLQLMRHTTLKKPYLIPYALLSIGAKWMGYYAGKRR